MLAHSVEDNAHLRCSAGSTWGMPCYSAAKSRVDNRITCAVCFSWLGSVQSILHHPNHVRRLTIRPVILQTGKPTPPILGTSARARRSGSLRLCKSSCNAHKKHTCKAQQLALAAVVVSRVRITPGRGMTQAAVWPAFQVQQHSYPMRYSRGSEAFGALETSSSSSLKISCSD